MTVWLVISVDGWRLGYGGRRVRTNQEAVWFATEEAAAPEWAPTVKVKESL